MIGGTPIGTWDPHGGECSQWQFILTFAIAEAFTSAEKDRGRRDGQTHFRKIVRLHFRNECKETIPKRFTLERETTPMEEVFPETRTFNYTATLDVDLQFVFKL